MLWDKKYFNGNDSGVNVCWDKRHAEKSMNENGKHGKVVRALRPMLGNCDHNGDRANTCHWLMLSATTARGDSTLSHGSVAYR